MTTIYFSRWIYLENGELLENGAVVVNDGYITSIGSRSYVKRCSNDRIVNLGDTLLLPGLINIHTHLEDGVLRGINKEPDETFASWTAKKRSRQRAIPEDNFRNAIRLGVRELLAEGVTTVVDSSLSGMSAHVLCDESIRSWVIQEFNNYDTDQEQLVQLEIEQLLKSKKERPALGFGVGPHTIYSLPPEEQKKVIRLSYDNNLLWATHLAESAEELQAFSEQQGDLFFHITRKKKWPFGPVGNGSMHFAITEGLIPSGGICIHCNYISGNELTLLAAKKVSIVVCPQYSHMLGHKFFPLDVALNRGVTICIGTEGILSPGFNTLFDELFFLKSAYPHIPAREILKWVTINPATAIKMQSKLGSISEGKFADLIGVRFPYTPGVDIIEELLVEEPQIVFVMVNGEEIIVDI